MCPLVQSSLVSIFRLEILPKLVHKLGLEGPKSLKSLVKVWSVRPSSPLGPFGLVVGSVWFAQGVCGHFGGGPGAPRS